MNVTLLSQIVSLIDRNSFSKLVEKHQSDKASKGNDSWTHLVSMLFCHLSGSQSVRDVSNGLQSATGNLQHLGVKKAPSKSSVSYINKHREAQLFEDFYFTLYEQLKSSLPHPRRFARKIKRKVFLLDSTTISVCLNTFDWARFRQKKGAVKLHTLLDYDSTLPVFMHMTEGSKHDLTVAKQAPIPQDAVIVMDRAYVDFQWLNVLDSNNNIFVTRLKDNSAIEVLENFLTNDKQSHILEDTDVALTGFYSKKKYPGKLRVVKVYDERNDKTMALLTNQLSWTADTISQLYKARWDIEVFFKHIKQRLKIKTFIGTSPNAVLIQVWTAMMTILLLTYLKNKAKYSWNLSNLVAFLRLNLFVKIDLWKWLDEPLFKPPQKGQFGQLKLFEGD